MIREFPKRNSALIVDEAHSSWTGHSASNLRRVLAGTQSEDGEHDDTPEEFDSEEQILKVIGAWGPQINLSFYAFTATPKHKTLELF